MSALSDIAGYQWNGDIYCVDCTEEMADPDELERLKDDTHRSGGPVFRWSEPTTQYHCGRAENCVNSTTHHEYPHDRAVGQPIHQHVLDYLEEPRGDPVIHEENEDTFIFTLPGANFKYKIGYEPDTDNLVLVERTNRGTLVSESYPKLPDGIRNAARQIVDEGKQAGAPWA